MKYEIHAAAPEEADFFYSNPEIDRELGCIGHLRGDFGQSGGAFWTSWWEHQSDLKTDEFREELDTVVNSIRENGFLKDRRSMAEYCHTHPEAKLPGTNTLSVYGFRMITEKHRYYFRCFPHGGDYNFYIYTYLNKDRGPLEKAKGVTLSTASKRKQSVPER